MVWPVCPFCPYASGFCQEVPNAIAGHVPQNKLEHFVPSRSSLSQGSWCNCIFLFSMLCITVPFIQSIVNCAAFLSSFLFLQFHRRIYKGIPLQFRGQVWSLLLDVPKMKEEMKDFYNVSSQNFYLILIKKYQILKLQALLSLCCYAVLKK